MHKHLIDTIAITDSRAKDAIYLCAPVPLQEIVNKPLVLWGHPLVTLHLQGTESVGADVSLHN